jgi:AcrR family transcriptional regulator
VDTQVTETEKAPKGYSAYTSRNRAGLVLAAQKVLADIGPNATIEQITNYALVSPTTVYKYFDNKEALFSEALSAVWAETLTEMSQGQSEADPLSNAIQNIRQFLRLRDRNPLLAKILKNTLATPDFVIKSVTNPAREELATLSRFKSLSSAEFNLQFDLFAFALTGVAAAVYVTESLDKDASDRALVIALRILNISEAEATALVSK